MTANKSGYFNHRNATLATRNDREWLGERELRTLVAMLSVEADLDYFAGKAIIDLGCGDQYIRNPFERRGATYRGIDIDECNLETQDIPVPSSSYDIAVSLALVEHLIDPGNFLTEVKRILKPGGLLWMSTPDIAACGAKFWNDPTHMHPYTRSSFRMLLKMNGFTDVLITPNYRCKSAHLYRDTDINFFRARHLMPFSGTSRFPAPEWLKGKSSGLFALAVRQA